MNRTEVAANHSNAGRRAQAPNVFVPFMMSPSNHERISLRQAQAERIGNNPDVITYARLTRQIEAAQSAEYGALAPLVIDMRPLKAGCEKRDHDTLCRGRARHSNVLPYKRRDEDA